MQNGTWESGHKLSIFVGRGALTPPLPSNMNPVCPKMGAHILSHQIRCSDLQWRGEGTPPYGELQRYIVVSTIYGIGLW